MDIFKSDKTRMMAIVVSFILIVIAVLVILIVLIHPKNDSSNNKSNVANITNIDNSVDDGVNNTLENASNTSNTSNSTASSDINENKGTLQKTINKEVYFWINDVLEKYYDSTSVEEALNLIDVDVKNELELTEENYNNYNEFESPIFRIDEIYEQVLNESKTAFLVKLKCGEEKSNVKNIAVWVEQDENSSVFSIYPYEYLKRKNYLDFKEGDVLPISDEKQIKENSSNKSEEEFSVSAEKFMKGLFERFKFDLLLDNEHLYSVLDEEYKNLKYPKIDDLIQYINDNKEDLYLDSLSTYKVIQYDEYVEYRAICNSKRTYVFNVKNMMDYTISLDNYKIIQNSSTYNAVMPQAKAKYCIDRVIGALNYKDYDFVYSKLNPVQKNNYYKNEDEFKEFLSKNFYEENNYEFEGDYVEISDNVYQFQIKVTDATGEDFSYTRFKMAVTLMDNDDFVISIRMGN